MADPAAKLSITVPSTMAAEIRRRVGARGVSGFVTRAIAHELEREQLTTYLEELDAEFGPVPKDVAAEARKAWRKR
ncbi:MAG: hypothetical protein U0271_20270 [Polyangiaceae bacterium]